MKLQASGWDIPLLIPTSETSVAAEPDHASTLTTGFSGTNDGKRLLPLTINQHDLPRLAYTNAEVLTYLLQTRNRGYKVAQDYLKRRLTERGLLQEITNMGIRVLIDAGAQILEMDNRTLAKEWLDMCPDAPGCVYFDENKPWVIYRRFSFSNLCCNHTRVVDVSTFRCARRITILKNTNVEFRSWSCCSAPGVYLRRESGPMPSLP